jgi:2-polyprenyl-3-methyl-5-hydroxy-6-metoxy-1,4-benzoquinol methylase
MSRVRERQLAYSDSQVLMLDEESRRAKATKIAAIIQHFRGRSSLDGLDVLDVGCSGGIVADELHRRGARMVGLDIDIPGLSKARDRFAESASFICADSERMPLADASVDVVICNHVYEHVVDPEQLLAELRRVVRPDGLLYLGPATGWVSSNRTIGRRSSLVATAAAHRYVRIFARADHYHGRSGRGPDSSGSVPDSRFGTTPTRCSAIRRPSRLGTSCRAGPRESRHGCSKPPVRWSPPTSGSRLRNRHVRSGLRRRSRLT